MKIILIAAIALLAGLSAPAFASSEPNVCIKNKAGSWVSFKVRLWYGDDLSKNTGWKREHLAVHQQYCFHVAAYLPHGAKYQIEARTMWANKTTRCGERRRGSRGKTEFWYAGGTLTEVKIFGKKYGGIWCDQTPRVLYR